MKDSVKEGYKVSNIESSLSLCLVTRKTQLHGSAINSIGGIRHTKMVHQTICQFSNNCGTNATNAMQKNTN